MFDKSDDYLYTEIEDITKHPHLSDILEFNLEYINGDTSWHPISLIKDECPHNVANYVVKNDLGLISNRVHKCWARNFLKFLQGTI